MEATDKGDGMWEQQQCYGTPAARLNALRSRVIHLILHTHGWHRMYYGQGDRRVGVVSPDRLEHVSVLCIISCMMYEDDYSRFLRVLSSQQVVALGVDVDCCGSLCLTCQRSKYFTQPLLLSYRLGIEQAQLAEGNKQVKACRCKSPIPEGLQVFHYKGHTAVIPRKRSKNAPD